MNKKVLYTLEYDKIVEQLAEKCSSEAAKEIAVKLLPVTDKAEIDNAQRETSAALSRLLKKGDLSFAGIMDPRRYRKHLAIGAALTAAELIGVVRLLMVAKRAKNYGKKERDDEREDALTGLFGALEPLTPVADEINRCLLSEEEIADDASEGLKSIRHRMRRTNDRIREKLSQMITQAGVRDYLQDAVVTMRDGRYCLPVKAEYKSQIKGMVHDASGSGATLFIEPMAVVQYNNEIRELEQREKEETEKILADLSVLVAEQMDAVAEDFVLLRRLDFIFAKGRLAKQMNGVAPCYNGEGIIRLRKARHPLLAQGRVVPIDLVLGEAYHQLIITGPNTGGKTVSLKTLGLLSLMGQAGLHIPAGDRSTLVIFDEIYADIGDEQSIEQSLSTFSSHMTNIIDITKRIEKDSSRTLVLFDELCAGTDPAEGAALAISILNLLREHHVLSMATTHYSELKMYALTTEGVENAGCEFDVETLSPTYRLLIGIPGKSNAFAISGKLGLSETLIKDARGRMDEDTKSFEDLLVDLESKRRSIEEREAAIRRDQEEIKRLRQSLKEKNAGVEEQRRRVLKEANEKASNILRDAKQTADAAIRNINKYGTTNPDVAKLEKTRGNLGKKLKTTDAKANGSTGANIARKKIDIKKLRVGDGVQVLSMDTTGTVHTLPNAKGDMEVSIGLMHMKVNVRDIALLDERESYTAVREKIAGRSSGRGSGAYSKAASIRPEIKLLGMTTDEAIAALDKYLDDARLSHLTSVRVVHGKGTGALRKAVHEYLRRQKVADYHLAEYGEGDSGVTIVEI